jgi:hypothetical protein
MTATTVRPGLTEGVTNGFTLIFRVRPGAAPQLRAALERSKEDPRWQESSEEIKKALRVDRSFEALPDEASS